MKIIDSCFCFLTLALTIIRGSYLKKTKLLIKKKSIFLIKKSNK